MPSAALRYCTMPGCPAKVPFGRCPRHANQARQHERRYYTGIPGLNYGRRWRRVTQLWLNRPENRLCRECSAEGRIECATDVDHIIPHRGDPERFWDESNWQPLCHSHHSAKTAREALNAR